MAVEKVAGSIFHFKMAGSADALENIIHHLKIPGSADALENVLFAKAR